MLTEPIWTFDVNDVTEPIWTFDVNDVTQNNSYTPLLPPLGVFLSLLRILRQTSTERFLKWAVVRDFWSVKVSLPLVLYYKNLTSRSRTHKLLPFLPCNAGQLGQFCYVSNQFGSVITSWVSDYL